jgi:hypothetical protein
MRQSHQSGFAERVFTVGSASAFLILMAAVVWGTVLPGALLK